MRCCNCGEKITNFDLCTKCKADVSGYKILVKASNSYYNQGLMRAQVRDLTGAVSFLRLALCVDKDNIDARNLLGLVYYEMGEVVSAFKEWVISKNYQPDNNMAGVFLKKIQSNQNKLDALNQCIKKYNRCLEYVYNDSFDVARIQLKKLTLVSPKFIKAYLLLSLILMRKGEFEKAKKNLNKVLSIDKGNALGRRYLEECEERLLEKKKAADRDYTKTVEKPKKVQEERRALSGHDVIIPKGSYREPSNGAVTVINLLAGVAIGVALMWFLIVPSREEGLTANNQKQIKSYVEEISANKAEISRLSSELDEAVKINDDLKNGSDSNNEELERIKKVLDAYSLYQNSDYMGCTEILRGFKGDELVDENAKKLYDKLWSESFISAYSELLAAGYGAVDIADYETGAGKFSAAYEINPSDEAAYYAAFCYRNLGDMNKAKEYYKIVIDNYPDSQYYGDSQNNYDTIG